MTVHRGSLAFVVFLLGLCSLPAYAHAAPNGHSRAAKRHVVAGLAAGSPSGGLNGVVGYGLGRWELRVSSGYYPAYGTSATAWGILAVFGVTRATAPHLRLQSGLFAAYMDNHGLSPPDQLGAGPEIGLSYWGFTVEAGLGINALHLRRLNLANLLVTDFQVGYLYRFP